MEAVSDSRFDPNYAMELLLDIGHEQSLENLLNKLVTRAIEQPTEIASAQVWLIDKAERCLRLAAASGNLPPGLSESANTIAVGTGVLGQIAATGRQIVLHQSDGDWERLRRLAPFRLSSSRLPPPADLRSDWCNHQPHYGSRFRPASEAC